MKLRIQGLTDLDPRAVPLPNGTEVTTTVERRAGERRIAAGAVGRVVASAGTQVTVRLVGVGEVDYLRAELVPRKVGQLGYARRRHAAWSALSGNVVVDALVGSQAWGLADAGSDTDRRGIFVLPFAWTTGLVEPPADLVSASGDVTYWEVGKALRQAVRADPNTLEMLFAAQIDTGDEIGEWILAERDAVVSAEIYGTFGRYALSQLERLGQSLRLAEHRELVLEWLASDGSLALDAIADRLAAATAISAPNPAAAGKRARDYIKQLYGSMYDKGLLASRDYAALQAFAASGVDHDLEVPRDLRPKNAYNLLRLIVTATTWLRDGEANFVVTGDLRAELLAIKQGQVELAEVLRRAEELTRDLEAARRSTQLPRRADVGRVDALLRRIRAEVARRWQAGAPGPFGQGAADFALAAWEDGK